MKTVWIAGVVFCLATAALGQEPSAGGGSGLNVSKLPPPVQPVGELIIRDGQVYRSQQEADAAEKELRERQQQAKRAAEQPLHPVAEKQAQAAERRLLIGGIIGALIVARLLWGSLSRKSYSSRE